MYLLLDEPSTYSEMIRSGAQPPPADADVLQLVVGYPADTL